jgi:hypothetical protein
MLKSIETAKYSILPYQYGMCVPNPLTVVLSVQGTHRCYCSYWQFADGKFVELNLVFVLTQISIQPFNVFRHGSYRRMRKIKKIKKKRSVSRSHLVIFLFVLCMGLCFEHINQYGVGYIYAPCSTVQL